MLVEGVSVVVPFLNESEVIEKFCLALDGYQKGFIYEDHTS